MKKGHRRTNSQTLGLSRPLNSPFEKATQNEHDLFQYTYHQQKPTKHYNSIQSLLQKSENSFAQRIVYIQNLEQLSPAQDAKNQFAFGKGINYKLSNYKLNMGEILQVPKSNQSTSLQGQNKLQIVENDNLFAHQACRVHTPTHARGPNQLSKPIKFQPKHLKTSSAVAIKKISKFQKPQKIQAKQQIKVVSSNTQKDNPLKRPKLEYQIPKKASHLGKQYTQVNQPESRVHKQSYLSNFLAANQNKKKKKSFIV